MALLLKQSTAVDVLIGPFVDKTDGATAETGESPTVKLSKNGQALAAKSDVTTPVHDADGYYNCELDATDTNTVGTVVLTVAASASALPVRHEFYVVEEAVYDAMYGASAAGPLQSTTAGRTLDVAATGEAGVDLGNVTGTLTQANVGWVDANSRVDVAAVAGTAQTAGDVTALITTVDTVVDGIQTDLDNGTDGLGAIKADTAAILVDTAEIGAAGAGLTNINLPNQTMDITGDITGNLSGSVGSVTGGATAAELAKVPKSDGTTSWNATALAAINAEADTAISDASLATAAAISALNDVSVADILTTQMTESYNADGAAPTLAQALHLVIAYLTERSVAGTTVTAKKLDGSTTAATFTLDSDTAPTSVTRAT